jgi:protein required for attachment to host cells
MANANGRKEWVLVCDGAKALVLANNGSIVQPKLATLEVREQPLAPDRDLSDDRPGRVFQSADGRRSAVEETDHHDLAEQRFLVELAQRIDQAVAGGETTSLVVVAPPRALGVLRGAFTPGVRGAIRAEIDKDLVKMPIPEIERHLAA